MGEMETAHRLSSDADGFLDLLKEQECHADSHRHKKENKSIARDLRNMSTKEKRTYIIITSVVLFFSQVTYYMLFPVLPQILLKIADGDAGTAAIMYTSLYSLSRGLQLLASPFLGTLSDVWGRKPVLLQSLVVTGLSSFLMAYQSKFWAFMVAHFCLGLGHITKPMCYTIAADLTEVGHGGVETDQETLYRVKAFGNMGVATSFAIALGPVLGAVITLTGSAQITLVISGAINLSLAILVVHAKFYGRQRCAKGVDLHIGHRFSFCCPRLPFKDREMGLATFSYLMAFVLATIGFGVYSIWYIYTASRYGWSTIDNGVFLSVYGVLQSLSQGPLLRLFVPGRMTEDSALVAGLWVNLLLFIGFGTALSGSTVFSFLPLILLGGFVDPVLRAKLAGLACTEDQGTLQGFLHSTASLCSVVGSTAASVLIAAGEAADDFEITLFTYTIPVASGAPFYFGAALFLIAALIINYNSKYGATKFQEITNENEALLNLKRSQSLDPIIFRHHRDVFEGDGQLPKESPLYL